MLIKTFVQVSEESAFEEEDHMQLVHIKSFRCCKIKNYRVPWFVKCNLRVLFEEELVEGE